MVGHDDPDLHARSGGAAAVRDALHGHGRCAATSVAGRPLGEAVRVLVHDADGPPDIGALAAQAAASTRRCSSRCASTSVCGPPTSLAHVAARFEPHDVEPPRFRRARARAAGVADPEGAEAVRRQDRAGASDRRAADAVTLRLATDWDRKRFPAERRDGRARDGRGAATRRVPAPDDRRAHAEPGRARAAAGAQTTTVELPKLFFVDGPALPRPSARHRATTPSCSPTGRRGELCARAHATDVTESAQGKPVPKRHA